MKDKRVVRDKNKWLSKNRNARHSKGRIKCLEHNPLEYIYRVMQVHSSFLVVEDTFKWVRSNPSLITSIVRHAMHCGWGTLAFKTSGTRGAYETRCCFYGLTWQARTALAPGACRSKRDSARGQAN